MSNEVLIKNGDKAEWGADSAPIEPERLPEGYPYKEIGLNIEWDGNTKGLASISGIFYKVSDVIPDNETLKNCFIEFYNKNTGVYSKVSVADRWDYMVSKGYVTENYVSFEELGVVVKSPTDAMPETGIYFMGSSASYTSKLYTETIHPMAPEFLPAGGGASSADVFIIHATTDETFTNVQLDKTAEQIYEAYQSRKYCLVDFNGTFYPVTSVETNGSKYLMSGNGFAFPTSEQGSAAGFELDTSDGVTWSVNRKTPYLYNVRFNRLQISGPGNQYYTISVDTNGNLTATVVT